VRFLKGVFMAMSTLSAQGQTTVPRAIRTALQLRAGSQLQWALHPEGRVVVAVQDGAGPEGSPVVRIEDRGFGG
jgi:bifunctional DNA-binding transcriptional regulator/antitoxin component of YhaV-PrlF toxin-antitoxin module